jgi:serine/threonine protein kinase
LYSTATGSWRKSGRGGFGVVWHARDEELQLDVALKFLPDLVARDPEAIEDLKREIRRGLRLAHSGIVRVNNFLRDEQLAAISMEYIDGTTLRQCKQAAPGGCLDAEDLRPFIEQLVEILAYVHDVARLVHRDLKPGNVMLTGHGEIKIADFGIASSVTDSMTRMTSTPVSGGTVSYMSPQQARGESPAVTDDIYALGATVFELLTGKPPFFRGDIVLQTCEVPPPTMNARREELGVTGKAPIPQSWELAVEACLAKEPHLRPQSVRQFPHAARLDGSSSHREFVPDLCPG